MSTRKKVTIDFALAEELGLGAEDVKQIKLLFDNDARILEDVINARSKTEETEYALRLVNAEAEQGNDLLLLYVDSSPATAEGSTEVFTYPDAETGETEKYITVGGAHLDNLIPLKYGDELDATDGWQDVPKNRILTGKNSGQALQIARLDANGLVIGGGICTVYVNEGDDSE